MTKPGLTIEQHQALGAELASMRNRLLALFVQTANSYPKASSPARGLAAALDRLDKARCELDGRFAREHPSEFTPAVYYPGPGGAAIRPPDSVQDVAGWPV